MQREYLIAFVPYLREAEKLPQYPRSGPGIKSILKKIAGAMTWRRVSIRKFVSREKNDQVSFDGVVIH